MHFELWLEAPSILITDRRLPINGHPGEAKRLADQSIAIDCSLSEQQTVQSRLPWSAAEDFGEDFGEVHT